MEAFNYENIWFILAYWGVIGTAVIFCVLAMVYNSLDKKWILVSLITLFVLNLGLIGGFAVGALERDASRVAYEDQVREHIKTTAGLDSVTGDLIFDPEVRSAFKVRTGEAEGNCYAAYPGDGNGAIEFACGAAFGPLEEGKEAILKDAEQSKE